MATLFGAYPFLPRLYADGGHAGPHQAALAGTMRQVEAEVVERSGTAQGFAVLPRTGDA